MVVVVVVPLTGRRVAVLERGCNLNGVSRGVALSLLRMVVVVLGAVWCLWLQVRWRRRRAWRRWRRRWRLGIELLVGAALHVAQHE